MQGLKIIFSQESIHEQEQYRWMSDFYYYFSVLFSELDGYKFTYAAGFMFLALDDDEMDDVMEAIEARSVSEKINGIYVGYPMVDLQFMKDFSYLFKGENSEVIGFKDNPVDKLNRIRQFYYDRSYEKTGAFKPIIEEEMKDLIRENADLYFSNWDNFEWQFYSKDPRLVDIVEKYLLDKNVGIKIKRVSFEEGYYLNEPTEW